MDLAEIHCKQHILDKLQKVLNISSLANIYNIYSVSGVGQNVIHNAWFIDNYTQMVTNIPKKDQLPDWLQNMMASLLRWPNPIDPSIDYDGFERDVFNVVVEFFENLKTPIIPTEYNDMFINCFAYLQQTEASYAASGSNSSIYRPDTLFSRDSGNVSGFASPGSTHSHHSSRSQQHDSLGSSAESDEAMGSYNEAFVPSPQLRTAPSTHCNADSTPLRRHPNARLSTPDSVRRDEASTPPSKHASQSHSSGSSNRSSLRESTPPRRSTEKIAQQQRYTSVLEMDPPPKAAPDHANLYSSKYKFFSTSDLTNAQRFLMLNLDHVARATKTKDTDSAISVSEYEQADHAVTLDDIELHRRLQSASSMSGTLDSRLRVRCESVDSLASSRNGHSLPRSQKPPQLRPQHNQVPNSYDPRNAPSFTTNLNVKLQQSPLRHSLQPSTSTSTPLSSTPRFTPPTDMGQPRTRTQQFAMAGAAARIPFSPNLGRIIESHNPSGEETEEERRQRYAERVSDLLQTICLMLPPAKRHTLHTLLRLLHHLSHADPPFSAAGSDAGYSSQDDGASRSLQQMVNKFWTAILCDLDREVLVRQLIAALIDHQATIMTVPEPLKNDLARIVSRTRNQLPSPSSVPARPILFPPHPPALRATADSSPLGSPNGSKLSLVSRSTPKSSPTSTLQLPPGIPARLSPQGTPASTLSRPSSKGSLDSDPEQAVYVNMPSQPQRAPSQKRVTLQNSLRRADVSSIKVTTNGETYEYRSEAMNRAKSPGRPKLKARLKALIK